MATIAPARPKRGKLTLTERKRFDDEDIEVIYRESSHEPGMLYYAPLEPRTYVDDGIVCEQDVPVTLRDGTVIYTDVYRPEGATNLPAIVAWSPYGKRHGFAPPGTPTFLLMGVPPGTCSPATKFEGPDPYYWCRQGYAVLNPDARGSGSSEGDLLYIGTQDGRDGYDFVEWAAARPWSNGKVTMFGNSWLAMVQWFIAAEQPPHLTCIAAWEGTSDMYREFCAPGGIPEVGFNGMLMEGLRGPGRIEDPIAMIRKYPLMNAYWRDKIAKLEKITVPAFVTAGWSHIHLRGSLMGFQKIASKQKWLRIHRDMEWPDTYMPGHIEDLRRFLDRYMKGIRNGWEMTPKVRFDVMDAGDVDYEAERAEKEWPLARTRYTQLFLDARTKAMSRIQPKQPSSLRYESTTGQAEFTMAFDEETELTGHMKLRLWVEAEGSNDMDLFVAVQKLDADGSFLPTLILGEKYPGQPGLLRVSHRERDEKESTPHQPVHTHRRPQLLEPKQIVPVDIEIYPSSKIFHAGERIRVVVSGHYLRDGWGWFEPFKWDLRNKGDHLIYTGGEYDSHLLVPVVPPKLQAGSYKHR